MFLWKDGPDQREQLYRRKIYILWAVHGAGTQKQEEESFGSEVRQVDASGTDQGAAGWKRRLEMPM